MVHMKNIWRLLEKMNKEEELKKAIEEMKDEFEIYTLPEYVVCSFEDKIKEIFQAGQLAEREKCLKMIEELKKRFEKRYYGWGDLPIWRKEFKELTQKIKEMK
jgi:pyridoxal/pyridoxine/pyridoxamine kinase